MKTMNAKLLQGRLRMCSVLAVLAGSAGLLSAQSLVTRIASEANSSEMTMIKGSEHPLANPANESGRVPASTRLSGITMMFSRSAAQEADLNALIAAQQDPTSPQYHQWITSDQFAARFGMAQADLDKVSSWLAQQGFAVDSVNRSCNAIHFSGSVGQVESAFQTQLHYYTAEGETHFAPSTALSIPAAFAPVVATVSNLDNFRPRPQHIVPRTGFTSGVSGTVAFAPGDMVTAYDIGPLYTSGVDGTGQTIAIMGQSFVKLSDIAAFQTAAGAPVKVKAPTLVLVPGTGNDGTFSPGDESESDLDLEWSSAIAPGANVVLVYTGSSSNSGGVYASIQYAVDEMIGNIISISYSSCEEQFTAATYASQDSVFQQAAVQGQTVMAASGDAGSQACAGTPNLTTAQLQSLSVNYPSSSAYVTSVGGTEIPASDGVDPSTGTKGANYSTYWNSNGTGGVSNDLVNSLKSYIPEIVWDDTSVQNGLDATGGGASVLVTRPSWQTGVPGIPAPTNANPCSSTNSGNCRLVPDIAFYSSPDLPGYVFCTSDQTSWISVASGGANNQLASCNSGFRDAATNDLTRAGGTSFATPIFAGMLALLNQKQNYTEGQGLINPTLYTLAANSTTYGAAFHDVTSGNNNCTAGTTLCGSNTTGFSAGTGYDEVTGLGSLDLAKIAVAWPTNPKSTASLMTTSTTVTPSNPTPNVNTNVTFTIAVSSTSGTPTGSVTLQIDGGTVWGNGGTTPAVQTLSNGTVQYTTTFATAGTHQVVAQYGGDATHATSVGVGEVAIAGSSSGKGTIAMSATSVTVSQGTSGSSTLTITPSGGYTGTVDLTFSTSNNTALANLCYNFTTILSSGIGTVAVTGTAPVTTQLTLDTLPADCGASIKSTGSHAFRALHPSGRASSNRPKPGTNPLPAGIAFAGLLLAGFLARGSRKLRGLACVIALGAVSMAMMSCGGGGGGGTSVTPDPPKGTYTITVTGTDSVATSITTSTSFTFTIN
jgi:hypothetical protein